MSTQTLTLACDDLRAACITQAKAAFTSASLSGPVATKIREDQASPYAKVGQFFEVRDGAFSDGDGQASRVTGSISFYSTTRRDVFLLARAYIDGVTGAPLVIAGFTAHLYDDVTVIYTEEQETGSEDVYVAICDLTMTLEPT